MKCLGCAYHTDNLKLYGRVWTCPVCKCDHIVKLEWIEENPEPSLKLWIKNLLNFYIKKSNNSHKR